MTTLSDKPLQFDVTTARSSMRAAVITTPHGSIETPAFIPVGTVASVKGVSPDQVTSTHAQAVLANAYHLYLRPGEEIIHKAGGLGKFMNWAGPTFTDSGGFQVMSLGAGYKKVIDMSDTSASEPTEHTQHEKPAKVTDAGVEFASHIDGTKHFFSPTKSIQIQHKIGADIIFAFDELTTLKDSKSYQQEALDRTHRWAQECLKEHQRLNARQQTPQALFGVLQGANYQDLREQTATFMSQLDFDGYGLGGAIEKRKIEEIIGWMTAILPDDKPRHLLGISEPEDLFAGVAAGADTFDCVAPTRQGRNGAIYTATGRYNVLRQEFEADFSPLEADCRCTTCQNFTRSYVRHLIKSKESLGGTLASIHNIYFTVNLVTLMRQAIIAGDFDKLRATWLKHYLK